MRLQELQDIVSKHPKVQSFGLISFHRMKPVKKENYYGTSVIRYLVSHVGKDSQRFNTTGDVYLNLRDIGKNKDFLLKVVAEEVAHIVEDTEDFKNEMYEFLKGDVK